MDGSVTPLWVLNGRQFLAEKVVGNVFSFSCRCKTADMKVRNDARDEVRRT